MWSKITIDEIASAGFVHASTAALFGLGGEESLCGEEFMLRAAAQSISSKNPLRLCDCLSFIIEAMFYLRHC